MEEVVEEPDARLAGILLEWNGIAVHNLDIAIVHRACVSKDLPRSAPMTRLFRCLTLTLLKWSTIERRTKGWTLVYVMGGLLMI